MFGLSFLDVMSCGLGAVILVFLIIKHNSAVVSAEEEQPQPTVDISQEISAREELSTRQRERIAALDTNIAKISEQQESETKELVDSLKRQPTQASNESVDALKSQLINKHAALLKERAKGKQLLEIKNAGKRQYLTGLQVKGKRIVILLDRSASMLDEHIVNIVRGKFLPLSEKLKADKWQWALSISNWLLAHLPKNSEYQIIGFNDKTTHPLKNKSWLPANDRKILQNVVSAIAKWEPKNGTNLGRGLSAASALKPPPDAIYLLTDSLPTQSSASGIKKIARKIIKRNTVTAEQRYEYFAEAVAQVKRGITINVILLPMEGDPRAAMAFWRLATATGGRFLAPNEDWP